MTAPITISFFGSSLLSAYWNGAATYYRGIIAALHRRGHRITFYEPDAFDRQAHRDIEVPAWAEVVVYPPEPDAVDRCLQEAARADVLVKASGVGVFDARLEAGVLAAARATSVVIFWDVDAPATLDRLRADPLDPLLQLVPRYDAVLTYGGGTPVIDAYRSIGARECVPIYNALDPATHHPVEPRFELAADLGFLGNRLPDREARVEEFFLKPARALPQARFLLGGSGWGDLPRPANVEVLGHVYTELHNAFNCSPRAVLNVSRESMARYGHSPATRVFEAAGAGACIITDAWPGLERFLLPESEVLVAHGGDDVVRQLAALPSERARAIGEAARRRVLAEHTYDRRAAEVETVLHELLSCTNHSTS
jgi:spore maturation protein CgeB